MRLTRRGRLTITLTVLTAVVLSVAYMLTQTRVGTVLGVKQAPPCTVTAAGDTQQWSFDDAQTAMTVAAVGERLGATVDATAAALDRTRDADEALGQAAVRGVYERLPDAPVPAPGSVDLARALLGYDGPRLVCTVTTVNLGNRTGDVLPREEPGPLGLTPRAQAARLAMQEVFGKQVLGGFSPQGVRAGHIDGSAHYEGRAVDVFYRPINPENTRRGWLLAQWLVAHAEPLLLATIIFDERIWTAGLSVQGWRTYQHPDGPTQNPILLHRDHVHLDVREGG